MLGYGSMATYAELHVAEINRKLKPGWTAHLNWDGRIFYCNHATQTSSWLPPADNWDSKSTGLPYGWEMAIDKDGRQYFINHLNKTTTYDDPRKEYSDEPPPQPREVELMRHPDMGFGFVAGSEKPVIVRFVTEGGPSVSKLLPGDQILRVNGEDVKKAPRDHVIELVRSCKHTVVLTVCQPFTDNSTRKSAILSAAKKARLKSNPSRVRFAEGVVINGSPLFSQQPSNYTAESCIPFMPNVLKVFLENGQTKSFKYDSSTTVQDVIESLQQKLNIKCIEHFSLCVEHIKSLRRNKLTLLDPKETLAKIAARPGAQHLRCLFRVNFVPKDAYELLRKDPVTFEYLYMQCCNDVVQERFAPELKYDIALRLAALHMQQHALSSSTNQQGKISVKCIEKDSGLERFVPVSLTQTMKRKELRKLLSHFIKLNQQLSSPGQKTLTAMQSKLHYLKIITELPSYGAKCFTTNLRDTNMETVILVSPKFGISQISSVRNSAPLTLCDIEDLSGICVAREDELSYQVELQMKDPERENILLSLEDREAEELVLILQGYYRLFTGRQLPVEQEKDKWSDDSSPGYHANHTVQEAGWNYPVTGVRETEDGGVEPTRRERDVDLSNNPPIYHSTKPLTANGHVPGHHVSTLPRLAADLRSVVAMGAGTGNISLPNSPLSHVRGVPLPGLTNRQGGLVDRNMNRVLVGIVDGNHTLPINLRSGHSEGTGSPSQGNRNRPMYKEEALIDPELNPVVTMEILESEPPNAIDQDDEADDTDAGGNRSGEVTRNDVLRRVAELQQIVQDAEQYLTEAEEEDTVSVAGSAIRVDGDNESLLNAVTGAGGGVSNANNALTHHDSAAAHSDVEIGVPKLKAADSLLLLTQIGIAKDIDINEAVKQIELVGDNEPSESDTDSLSTPNESPSHKPVTAITTACHTNPTNKLVNTGVAKASNGSISSARPPSTLKTGSSFGLHSPDNIGGNMSVHCMTAQEILQRLKDETHLPYQFAEGTLYLDPDIIDLTMIPPPITPDSEDLPMSAVSFPPTPFADRQNLEAELNMMSNPHAMSSVLSWVAANNPSLQSASDIESFIASVTVPPPPPTNPTAVPEVKGNRVVPANGAALGAGISNSNGNNGQHSPIQELTPEQISAYIIPPPPMSSSSASSDSEAEMISRLQTATDTIRRIVKGDKKQMRCSKDSSSEDVKSNPMTASPGDGKLNRGSAAGGVVRNQQAPLVPPRSQSRPSTAAAPPARPDQPETIRELDQLWTDIKNNFHFSEAVSPKFLSRESPLHKDGFLSDDNEHTHFPSISYLTNLAANCQSGLQSEIDIVNGMVRASSRNGGGGSGSGSGGESSGYDTYTSSVISNLGESLDLINRRTDPPPYMHHVGEFILCQKGDLDEINHETNHLFHGYTLEEINARRMLNTSFSDNSSTVSCGSSSTAEFAGSQADTEDNAGDLNVPGSVNDNEAVNSPVMRKAQLIPRITSMKRSESLSSAGMLPPLSPNKRLQRGTSSVSVRSTPSHRNQGMPTDSGSDNECDPAGRSNGVQRVSIKIGGKHSTISSSSDDGGHRMEDGLSPLPSSPRKFSNIPRPHTTTTGRKPPRANPCKGKSPSFDAVPSSPAPIHNSENNKNTPKENGLKNSYAANTTNSVSCMDISSSPQISKVGNGESTEDRATGGKVEGTGDNVGNLNGIEAGSISPNPLPNLNDLGGSNSLEKSSPSPSPVTRTKLSPIPVSESIHQENSNGRSPQPGVPLTNGSDSSTHHPPSRLPKLNPLQKFQNSKSTDCLLPPVPPPVSALQTCSSLDEMDLAARNGVWIQDSQSNHASDHSDDDFESFEFEGESTETLVDNLLKGFEQLGKQYMKGLQEQEKEANEIVEVPQKYQETIAKSEIELSNKNSLLPCDIRKRDSFYGAEDTISCLLIQLDDALTGNNRNRIGGDASADKARFIEVKDALFVASKQFVTASKLLVKSATESEEKLVQSLTNCLNLLDEMFSVATILICSSSSLQTHDLALRVKDVALTFLQTLQAASQAVGKSMDDPTVNALMRQATTLAAVLTALMRTLKVFTL